MKEKSTNNIAQSTAEDTTKRLTALYGKKVVTINFNGTPGVMFKNQVQDEHGNSKTISHYP